MGQRERKDLIAKIEGHRKSKVLCYLTSDRPNAAAHVAKDILPVFVEHLRALHPVEKIDVFVFTLGGDTLAGFGLGRLLREFAGHISVLIPDKCHSAGTLFALGCNEIVMSRGATLSPIDPSISGPLNPAVQMKPGQTQIVPLSVESVAGFKGLVTDDWGVKGEEALSQAFKILAEKVHPLALGDVYRSRQQIEQLATNLLKQHREDADAISRIVNTLTKGLGSHDYLIYRSEAKDLLGTQVVLDDTAEDLVWQLYQDFRKEMMLGIAYDQNLALQAGTGQPRTTQVTLQAGRIESLAKANVWERKVRLTEISVNAGGVPQKGVMEEVLDVSCREYT